MCECDMSGHFLGSLGKEKKNCTSAIAVLSCTAVQDSATQHNKTIRALRYAKIRGEALLKSNCRWQLICERSLFTKTSASRLYQAQCSHNVSSALLHRNPTSMKRKMPYRQQR
jgi:hypothetical protein